MASSCPPASCQNTGLKAPVSPPGPWIYKYQVFHVTIIDLFCPSAFFTHSAVTPHHQSLSVLFCQSYFCSINKEPPGALLSTVKGCNKFAFLIFPSKHYRFLQKRVTLLLQLPPLSAPTTTDTFCPSRLTGRRYIRAHL